MLYPCSASSSSESCMLSPAVKPSTGLQASHNIAVATGYAEGNGCSCRACRMLVTRLQRIGEAIPEAVDCYRIFRVPLLRGRRCRRCSRLQGQPRGQRWRVQRRRALRLQRWRSCAAGGPCRWAAAVAARVAGATLAAGRRPGLARRRGRRAAAGERTPALHQSQSWLYRSLRALIDMAANAGCRCSYLPHLWARLVCRQFCRYA